MAVFRLYRDAFADLPARAYLLAGAGFLNRAGSMVVPFLGLYLKDRFGYSPTAAGFVVGLYGIGALLGSWLGGVLCDRLGAVRVQIVTLFGSAAWMLLMSQVQSPLTLAIATFVLGIINESFRPGSLTAAAVCTHESLRRKALSLNRLAMNAGWAFGPTVGGYLIADDFRWMFFANALACTLAACWLLWQLHGWNPKPPRPTTAALVSLLPLRDRHFLALMGANLLVMLAFMQYFTTGVRVLEDQGQSRAAIGWFLAVNPIVITLCEMPTSHALLRFASLRLIALGSLVIGLGYLAMLLPLGMSAAVLAMLLVAGGELLQMPPLGAHVNDLAPDHARGAYNGAYGMTFCLGLVLAPPLGGFVYDQWGHLALWCMCALLGALASLWVRSLSAPPRAALDRA